MNIIDNNIIKQLKTRVDEELKKREIAILEFWYKELKSIYNNNHKELAALKNDLRIFISRIETRLCISGYFENK